MKNKVSRKWYAYKQKPCAEQEIDYEQMSRDWQATEVRAIIAESKR